MHDAANCVDQNAIKRIISHAKIAPMIDGAVGIRRVGIYMLQVKAT